jgi:hypothetical protein
MSTWDYPLLTEIARESGEEALVDCVVGPNAGAFLGALPMKEIEGLTESVDQLTAYPGVSWRNIGEGISVTRGREREIYFNVKLLSTLSEADALKAEKYKKGVEAYRAKEAKKHLKAMGKEADYAMFYNEATDKSIEGVMRLLDSSADTYVSAGASAETYSIYAFVLGDEGVYGFYSPFADGKLFSVTPYSRRMKNIDPGSTNKEIAVYQTEFNALVGLAIANPNAIGRVTKFDSSNSLAVSDMYSLYDKMGQKPDLLVTNFAGIAEFSALKESIVKMTPEESGLNYEVWSFDGIPIIVDTNLVSTEGSL